MRTYKVIKTVEVKSWDELTEAEQRKELQEALKDSLFAGEYAEMLEEQLTYDLEQLNIKYDLDLEPVFDSRGDIYKWVSNQAESGAYDERVIRYKGYQFFVSIGWNGRTIFDEPFYTKDDTKEYIEREQKAFVEAKNHINNFMKEFYEMYNHNYKDFNQVGWSQGYEETVLDILKGQEYEKVISEEHFNNA